MTRLRISRAAWRALCAHAAGEYPLEACGILVGKDDTEARRVASAVAVANAHPGPRAERYEIDPARFLEIERSARREGMEVVGFYHSHPGHEPAPSRFDRERAWAYYSYVIVRTDPAGAGEARSWRSSGGELESEELLVEES